MPLKVIDLFSGCGGLSLGLSQAGLEIAAACEVDQWAGDTYARNHPKVALIRSDIRKTTDNFWLKNYRGEIDLVAGGPPCQGFSVSGKRQYGSLLASNTLIEEFLRVVAAVQPRAVLIENVPGFKTGYIRPGIRVLHFVTKSLHELGYHTEVHTLQAAAFGVPSVRSRFFLFACKTEVLISPFLAETHGAKLTRPVTVLDAIGDLPPIDACEGSEEVQEYASKPANYYQRQMRSGSKGVFNHVAMNHSPRLIERFKSLPPGASGYRIGRTISKNGEVVTVYKSNNQRLHPDKVSLCITANFQSTYIHPILDRNLTAREAARLLTFPDTFVFCGKRTQMSSKFLKKYGREHEDFLSQYNQIGNAVPPLLGRKLGEAIRRVLTNRRTRGIREVTQLSAA